MTNPCNTTNIGAVRNPQLPESCLTRRHLVQTTDKCGICFEHNIDTRYGICNYCADVIADDYGYDDDIQTFLEKDMLRCWACSRPIVETMYHVNYFDVIMDGDQGCCWRCKRDILAHLLAMRNAQFRKVRGNDKRVKPTCEVSGCNNTDRNNVVRRCEWCMIRVCYNHFGGPKDKRPHPNCRWDTKRYCSPSLFKCGKCLKCKRHLERA